MTMVLLTALGVGGATVLGALIGFIFKNEKDAIQVIKYKNIAEAFEAATDAAKRVSDSIRKMILRYQE